MDDFESQSEHALYLAKSTLNKLVDSDCTAPVALRGCLSVASFIADKDNKKWINTELNGYLKKDDVPEYRSFKGFPKDAHGNQMSVSEAFHVLESVYRIEYSVVSKKNFNFSVDSRFSKFHTFEPDWCFAILESVKNRCLNYLLNIIAQLQYSGNIHSIIENIQKEVDTKLIDINKEINDEIESITNSLNSKNSEGFSKAAHSSRRVLKLLADEVFPAKEEPYKDSEGKSHSVKEDAYMNRIIAFLDKNKADKLLKANAKYLASYLDSLRELAGKGEHSKEISPFEAEQIVIHTYLVIADVLRLRDDKGK